MTIKQQKDQNFNFWKEVGLDIDKDCTCNECLKDLNQNALCPCKWAFDLYNTNGDCLAEK